MKTITHKSSYSVGSGGIRLAVVIGNGQFGSTTVVVGDQLFDHERRFDHEIGQGAELVGQKILAVSVVTDTNPQTNFTSVTYQLTGGVEPWTHVSKFTLENQNDSVKFLAEIELTP